MSDAGLIPQRLNLAVLTHNALDYTKLCVESLYKNTSEPFNLFILDNVSTDETPSWLAEQKMGNFRYHLSPVNTGVPGGRNKLIEMITPHLPDDGFIIFMDNDIELLSGWDKVYLDFFREHSEAGIASAWGHLMQVWSSFRTLRSLPRHSAPVDVACGGFVCWIKSAAIRAVGPFDENLGLFWHEDDDYSVRTLGAGFEVYALPHAPVIHHEHKSGVANDGIKRDGSPKNQAYLVDKWKKAGYVDDGGRIIRPAVTEPAVLSLAEGIKGSGFSRNLGGYRLMGPDASLSAERNAGTGSVDVCMEIELIEGAKYSGLPLKVSVLNDEGTLAEVVLPDAALTKREIRFTLKPGAGEVRIISDRYYVPVLSAHSPEDNLRWSLRLNRIQASPSGSLVSSASRSSSRIAETNRAALHWSAPVLDFSPRAWNLRSMINEYGSELRWSPVSCDDSFVEEINKQPEAVAELTRSCGRDCKAEVQLYDYPRLVSIRGRLPWRTGRKDVAEVARVSFDGDRLPAGLSEELRQLEEVWCESRFHAEALQSSGLPESKIYISPTGIDTRLLDPAMVQPIPEYASQGRFTFLTVTNGLPEDGWDVLIQAYLSEFTAADPVNLLIATAENRITVIHRELIEYLKQSGVDGKSMPQISIVGMRFSQAVAPMLYRSADALLAPRRAASLDPVILEAMAMKLPVVATDWGAGSEHLSPEHSWPLAPAALLPLPQGVTGHPEARWAEVSPRTLALTMRQVLNAPEINREKGQRAREYVTGKCGLRQATQWMKGRVEEIRSRRHSADPQQRQGVEASTACTKQPGVRAAQVTKVSPGNDLFVSIDARTLIYPESYQRGIGQYSLSHLEALAVEKPNWHFRLLFDRYQDGSGVDKLLKRANVSWSLFDDALERRPDIHHICDPLCLLTGADSPFRIAPAVPLSVTFYDLIPMVLKQSFSDQWPLHHKVAYESRLGQLVRSDAAVLAISEHTRKDLHELLGVPLERISTIMAGLNREVTGQRPDEVKVQAVLEKYQLRAPFFMTVGGLDPHKGFGETGKAFLSATQKANLMLAVVGSDDDPFKGMYRKAFEKHISAGVVFTGFVSREELECLYAASSGLLFPSRYEGFGLPVLEAMAAGCPVICSDAASLPEVAGDAALYVHPGDAEGIERQMLRLMRDPALRAGLIDKGYSQARLFTWQDVARKTVAVWNRILGEHSIYAAQ